MCWQEFHKVQWGEVQSPGPGKEQPHVPGEAAHLENSLAEKDLRVLLVDTMLSTSQ